MTARAMKSWSQMWQRSKSHFTERIHLSFLQVSVGNSIMDMQFCIQYYTLHYGRTVSHTTTICRLSFFFLLQLFFVGCCLCMLTEINLCVFHSYAYFCWVCIHGNRVWYAMIARIINEWQKNYCENVQKQASFLNCSTLFGQIPYRLPTVYCDNSQSLKLAEILNFDLNELLSSREYWYAKGLQRIGHMDSVSETII